MPVVTRVCDRLHASFFFVRVSFLLSRRFAPLKINIDSRNTYTKTSTNEKKCWVDFKPRQLLDIWLISYLSQSLWCFHFRFVLVQLIKLGINKSLILGLFPFWRLFDALGSNAESVTALIAMWRHWLFRLVTSQFLRQSVRSGDYGSRSCVWPKSSRDFELIVTSEGGTAAYHEKIEVPQLFGCTCTIHYVCL